MKQFNQKAYPYISFWYDRQKEKNNWLSKFFRKFPPKSEQLQRQYVMFYYKILKSSQKNSCYGVPFLVKLHAWRELLLLVTWRLF